MREVNRHEGLSVTQWAKVLGLTRQGLHLRIQKHGWVAAVALGGPAIGGPGRVAQKYQEMTAKEWSSKFDVPPNTLYRWVRKHGWDEALQRCRSRQDEASQ